MKRFVLCSALVMLLPAAVFSQSATELAAAKAMARSYGYSDKEINSVLNHDINGTAGRSTSSSPMSTTYAPVAADAVRMMPETEDRQKQIRYEVYGQDFFVSSGFGIIPSFNAPAPESYVLGPGDEIVVDIWGATNSNMSLSIGNDGSVNIENLGPVYIAGANLKRAESVLRAELSRIYSGLGVDDADTYMRVSVGKIKGVSVNVVGEVVSPGIYTIPSLSSLTSAIYMAGGLTENGSVRNITLYRNGKAVSSLDLYDFIFKGKFDEKLRLQDNDIISVDSYSAVVKVGGSVTRPMKYEMKGGETLADLLVYVGGFAPEASQEAVFVQRTNSAVGVAYNVTSDKFDSFVLEKGDSVGIRTNSVSMKNFVAISGTVVTPGYYAISESLSSVSQLINAAGGLLEDAYLKNAQISRLDENRIPAMVSFSLEDILSGAKDVALQRDDSLKIYSINELRDTAYIVINGEVRNPEEYEYSKGMTLFDAVLLAGGFNDGADMTQVEIASRGGRTRGVVSTYDLEENPDAFATELKPYDVVSVRRLTYFRDLQSVSVSGEVLHPGSYVIDKTEVRLSDVIAKTGGFTDEAFVDGARLTRHLTKEELDRQKLAVKIANQNLEGDTISMDFLSDEFYIGIDLAKAIEKPGSSADIVLRSGDVINVPQMNNTVKISGGVFYPTTTSFDEDYTWRDYVDLAGGYTKKARKTKVYAVYMNGKVKTRNKGKIANVPGMEIVVPERNDSEVKSISPAEIAAIASSTSSIATVIVALTNLLK